MKLTIVAFFFGLIALCAAQCDYTPTTASGSHAPPGPYCKNQVLFEESFDTLDLSIWDHELTMNGGGNGEFQWYVNDRRNSYVQDGRLYIRPTLTEEVIPDLTNCHIVLDPCTTPWAGCEHVCTYDQIAPPVRSAKVRTVDSFAFKYGRVDMRVRMPAGDWIWPALWFMPKHSVYGNWPRSGEIDLNEMRSNRNLYNGQGHNMGVEEFGNTLHFGTESYNSAYWSSWFSSASPPGQGWHLDFHNYQMEWAPSHFSFSVDGNWIGTIPVGSGFFDRGQFEGFNIWAAGDLMAPFDQEFYFIINTAIGGTNYYFPEEGNASGKPWRNNSPTAKKDFWDGRGQWLDSWKLDENNAFEASLIVDHVIVYAY